MRQGSTEEHRSSKSFTVFFDQVDKKGLRFRSRDNRFRLEDDGSGKKKFLIYDDVKRPDPRSENHVGKAHGLVGCRNFVREYLIQEKQKRLEEKRKEEQRKMVKREYDLKKPTVSSTKAAEWKRTLSKRARTNWKLQQVLVKCIELSDERGYFTISQTKLSAELGFKGMGTITNSLNWLIDNGYIEKVDYLRTVGTAYKFTGANIPDLLTKLPDKDPLEEGKEKTKDIKHPIEAKLQEPIVVQLKEEPDQNRPAIMAGRAMVKVRELEVKVEKVRKESMEHTDHAVFQLREGTHESIVGLSDELHRQERKLDDGLGRSEGLVGLRRDVDSIIEFLNSTFGANIKKG